MRKIAIYGKGGIGKSTTVSNLSISFSKLGYKVMQIGCDPKADSTKNLVNGKVLTTVLDAIATNEEDLGLEDIVTIGDQGVFCVEAGGPKPGIGCAGRGIITAFEKLEELEAFELYQPDIVLYDVLGDVVCGGFSMPLRRGNAKQVYIVTSGEMMSLYAATNISHAITNLYKTGGATLAGLIENAKNIADEDELVSKVAIEIGTDVAGKIARDPLTQKAETENKTVSFLFPNSEMAKSYMSLARKIVDSYDQNIK